MISENHISVIIPALNEELSIAAVIGALPAWVDQIVVVDNGSTDDTRWIASGLGVHVVPEPIRGYGRACLTGIAALDQTDVVVFLDADFSDDPTEIDRIVDAVVHDTADLVIGVRIPVDNAPAALTPFQRYGNSVACHLITWIWGHRYHDLGPFRAIRFSSLANLGMTDKDYGWTIEMQIKAIVSDLRIAEVEVRYRERIGQSKISGTIAGTMGAACKIMATICRYAWRYRIRRQGIHPI